MSKIYLKTYCYAPHEIDFIVANLAECYDHIEKMIVCEFDINHTGVKRDFEYTNLKDRIPEHLRDKLDYHSCEVFNETARAYEDEDAIHNINEPVMRSYFTKLYDFNNDDIIYISGRQARIVRVGIRNTVFYMLDRKTKMLVPNEQLKQLTIEKTLPKNGGAPYLPKGCDPNFVGTKEVPIEPPPMQVEVVSKTTSRKKP